MKVVPPAICVRALVTLKFKSPFTVTPVRRLPLADAMIRVCPPAKPSVPPLIVPPLSVHEPVLLSSVSVCAVFRMVPVMFTVPPVLLHVPMPPVTLKVPPKFTVAALTLTVPALVQGFVGAIVRMPPDFASSVPLALLVKLAAAIVIVRPLTWLEISPLFASVIAPPKFWLSPMAPSPVSPAFVRITPVGPTVKVPAVPFISTWRRPATAPSKSTVPVSVCPGANPRLVAFPARCACVKVVPPAILVRALVVFKLRSPFTVTPVTRFALLAAIRRVPVPLTLTTVLLIVPPLI